MPASFHLPSQLTSQIPWPCPAAPKEAPRAYDALPSTSRAPAVSGLFSMMIQLHAITISGAVFEVMVRAAFTLVRKLENAVGKLVKRFLRVVTTWPRPRPGVVRCEIAISLGV